MAAGWQSSLFSPTYREAKPGLISTPVVEGVSPDTADTSHHTADTDTGDIERRRRQHEAAIGQLVPMHVA